MPPDNSTTVLDGTMTSAKTNSLTMDRPVRLLTTLPSLEIPLMKWMMVQMLHLLPLKEKIINSIREPTLKWKRISSTTHKPDNWPPSTMVSTTIFHFQLTHTTKDQRLELSSNGSHSELPSHHQIMNQTTMESQPNSELNTATTTQLSEETRLSKIDEKIKKLWQINNIYGFSFTTSWIL